MTSWASLAGEVKIRRIPSANVGIGAATGISIPDAGVGVRTGAVVAGVELRRGFWIAGGGLREENAVGVQVLIAVPAAAKFRHGVG